MLCSANLQDQAVFAMCSLKVSWSSKITPRFLTEVDGVIIDVPNWIEKSCCRVGVAGTTRSSVFARLSCRWCSFIHAEMSARQPEIRAATVGSSGWKVWFPTWKQTLWSLRLCLLLPNPEYYSIKTPFLLLSPSFLSFFVCALCSRLM